MFRYVATLLYAYSAVALGASLDLSKVNGSIDVGQAGPSGRSSVPFHPDSRKPTSRPDGTGHWACPMDDTPRTTHSSATCVDQRAVPGQCARPAPVVR
jgi:hypothetical protein